MAKKIQVASKAQAPYRTGAMVRTSYMEEHQTGDGFTAYVGYRSEVALWQHEGVPPHREPKVKKGPMVFYWERYGRWVVFAHVNHPGVKPNRFLTGPMKAIARSNGFKAISVRLGP